MPPADESRDLALDATAGDGSTVASEAPGVAGRMRELPVVAGNRYVLLGREVGRGGLGRVLEARDEVLDRRVAVKELFSSSSDDASRRRFTREALITARLQHPSIVPIYDAGTRADRAPFYAMKLIAGQPLDRAIADAKTLAERLALLPSVLAVANAIAYAHSERIIHRDLKPGNVLVGQFGETIVIDWGLAKDLSIDDRDALDAGPYRGDASDRTVEGALLGTPGYMAPEQAAGEEVDERADVYALGAILYHLVSGVLPHQGTTIEEVIARLLEGDIRPLLEREPNAPRDLAAIVGKAMAMNPAQRYRTARELADDLRRFQTGQLVAAHHYTLGQRVMRAVKRNRALSAVIAGAVLVLAVGATYSISRIMSEKDAAVAQRAYALETANEAILSKARTMRDRDPAEALVWLGRLNSEAKSGWDEARVLAAEALAHPRLVRTMSGPDLVAVSLDGRRAAGFDHDGFWIADLAGGAPTRIYQHGDPTWRRRVEICDDGKRAFAHAFGDMARTYEMDLVARSVKELRGRAWVGEVERCKLERAFGRSEHGLSYNGTKLSTAATEAAWLTPDRKHIVALERTGGLRRWAVDGTERGTVVATPPSKTSRDPETGWSHTPIALSRDGSTGVLVYDGAGLFFSFTTGKLVELAKQDEITGLAVVPDGSYAIVNRRATVRIANDAEPAEEGTGEFPAGKLAMRADGEWIAGLREGVVSIMEVAGGATAPLYGHRDVTTISFLPDGKLLTAGSGMVRIWEPRPTARRHAHGNARAAALSPDGTWYVIDTGSALVRRELAGTTYDVKPHGPGDLAIAIADSGDVAFSVGAGVFRWRRGGDPERLGQHTGTNTVAIEMLRDGTVITASERSVARWGPTPRYITLPRERSARQRPPRAFTVDESGRRALVACIPQLEVVRACVVDLIGGRTDVLEESQGPSAMSATGGVAITGTLGDAYLVWDLDRGTSKRFENIGELRAVGITRDGTRAVVGGPLDMAIIDVAAPAMRRALRVREPAKGTIQFSPDGRTFVDSTHTLWNVAAARGRRIHAHAGALRLLDGSLVVVGWDAIVVISDELPRDPAALKAELAKLPYTLDEHDMLEVR